MLGLDLSVTLNVFSFADTGYLFTRGSFIQAVFLMPLPVATFWGMGYFNEHYASKFF
jgi:hypothetical protein